MKLVLLDCDTLGGVNLEPLKELGELITYPYTLPEDTVKRSFEADIVITNKVVFNKEEIDALPNLKLIAITATGVNNVDLEYAEQKGIVVKNVSGYSTDSVVQTTFMLALSIIGRLEYYSNYTRDGKWSKSPIFTNLDMPFFEIAGKEWGIIGLGAIGKKVAKVASAFGANVSYYATSGVVHNKEYPHKNLEDLLKNCDIISIHAPLNENTQNLISKDELALMKDGAVLINVGRGGIVDESTLAKAIDSKKLLVGLDVTKSEPIEANNPLLKVKAKDNLIITPHIAWGSIEARERLIESVANNIREFINERA